jgi:hypothetical protein
MLEIRIKDKHKQNKGNAKQQSNTRRHNDWRTLFEEVTEFSYLGAKLTKDGNSEYEVTAGISKVRGAFAALMNIWKTNKISNRTNINSSVQK